MMIFRKFVTKYLRKTAVPGRIGSYTVTDKISEGASAVVYKGKDVITGKTVALKVLRSHLSDEKIFVDSFLEEADFGNAIKHPNLIEIHERGVVHGSIFIVMEYLEGKTLSACLAEGRSFSQDEVLDITAQILSGLKYLGEIGIVHRDIKSANIIMTKDSCIKIMDFGLSRFPLRTADAKTGALVGTLRYISPEQVKGEPIDERSDLYSLGVVMYELLTGMVPFQSTNADELLYQIRRVHPKPPSEQDAAISPFIDMVVNKALQKNPANRYKNADAMLDECNCVRRIVPRKITVEDLRCDFDEMKSLKEREDWELALAKNGVRQTLIDLGLSFLELSRVSVKNVRELDRSTLRRCQKAMDYFELAQSKKHLIKAHFLMYRIFSLDKDREAALMHMKNSFDLIEEIIRDMGDEEERTLFDDREIASLLKEAKGIIESGNIGRGMIGHRWEVD